MAPRSKNSGGYLYHVAKATNQTIYSLAKSMAIPKSTAYKWDQDHCAIPWGVVERMQDIAGFSDAQLLRLMRKIRRSE